MIINDVKTAQSFIDDRLDGVNDDGWEIDVWSEVGEDGILRVGFMDWDTQEGATYRVVLERQE